ncbi:hypothetical protein RintRC_7412 [Richelia intracellularis]|nr:hypothetical protein RintRC_7412 [Richelia intracellularis]
MMVNKVQEIIQQEFAPDGFNVGINIDKHGGQTKCNAHSHSYHPSVSG